MIGEGPAKPLRVMLLEDHAAFRQALALVAGREPDMEIVAQASSLAEAQDSLGVPEAPERIDAAVIDLALPDGNGADLVEDLRRHNPEVAVLVLSATLGRDNLARAVEAGVDGVLDKAAGLGEIVRQVRRLAAGAVLPSQEEMMEWLRLYGQRSDADRGAEPAVGSLTSREREALRALAEGLDGEGVAERLCITVGEERALVANILAKLGVRSRLQALAVAARHGAVEIG